MDGPWRRKYEFEGTRYEVFMCMNLVKIFKFIYFENHFLTKYI